MTRAVDDATMPSVEHAVERGRGRRHRVEELKPRQQVHLIAGNLLNPEFRRVDRVAVDQHDAISGATEDHGGERSAQAAADDRDVRFARGWRLPARVWRVSCQESGGVAGWLMTRASASNAPVLSTPPQSATGMDDYC
jgi:hypothetical protein